MIVDEFMDLLGTNFEDTSSHIYSQQEVMEGSQVVIGITSSRYCRPCTMFLHSSLLVLMILVTFVGFLLHL
jgi:hypothetical protein